MHPSETFDFTHDGKQFRAFIEYDPDAGSPWEREEGHVPVSDWVRRDKMPSEVIINRDRGSYRFVCLREAHECARAQGWGLASDDMQALCDKLNREPTKREVISRAVQLDIERLRAWCADEWCYVGVCVSLLGPDGQPVGDRYAAACWGIESDCDDYIKEVASDLAGEALSAARVELERIGTALRDEVSA